MTAKCVDGVSLVSLPVQPLMAWMYENINGNSPKGMDSQQPLDAMADKPNIQSH